MEEGLYFNQNNVQTLALENLAKTIHENYSNGLPCGGIYHFELLQTLFDYLKETGFKPEVTEIFAANNKDRYRPGVSIDEKTAQAKGEHSYEAHILRRVYANVKLCESGIDGIDLNMAVAYHQLGIQVAFGPMVRVCHNQTILAARDVFSNQNISQCGNKIEIAKNVNAMLEAVKEYLSDIQNRIIDMTKTVKEYQNQDFLRIHLEYILRMLMEARIRHDSNHGLIHSPVDYPLSSSQINAAFERFLIEEASRKPLDNEEKKDGYMTWWDALNIFNVDLKPGACIIPSIIGQSYGLGELFENAFQMTK